MPRVNEWRIWIKDYEALRDAPIPGDWAERAACRGLDTELFFPTRGTTTKTAARQLTKLCDTCPVLAYCRTYSLRYPVTGWWGSMTEEERRRRRREARKAS